MSHDQIPHDGLPGHPGLLGGCSPKMHASKTSNSDATIDWYAYTKDHKYDNAAELYQLTDSMIRLHGDKVGYLMSRKVLILILNWRLEYRWNMDAAVQRGTGKKNSGVMWQCAGYGERRTVACGYPVPGKGRGYGRFYPAGKYNAGGAG